MSLHHKILMQRVPVIAEDSGQVKFWMGFNAALDAKRAGRIEEVFSGAGEFLGVVLREAPAKPKDQFHRGSLNDSPTSLTKSDCMANAEAEGSVIRQGIAKAKVLAWPDEHDQKNVVISGGKIHGAVIVKQIPDSYQSFA